MPPIRERELIKPPVGHLLVLFIAVPVVELALLIEIGQRVGTVGTIGLIMGTGIVGASLARQQGISTLARLRADLDAGRWPAEPIVDGVLILVAAAVLVTPGVLTDLAGFLCLVPACRRLLRRYLYQRFEGTIQRHGPQDFPLPPTSLCCAIGATSAAVGSGRPVKSSPGIVGGPVR